MRSQAGKHTVGPTIKLQHRNMLEKNSQHTYYTVSAEDSNVRVATVACSSMAGRFAKFYITKCNEANLHNPEPTECSKCDGCWHFCCIFPINCLNYGQSGDIDNRSRWLKPVSVGGHRSLLLI